MPAKIDYVQRIKSGKRHPKKIRIKAYKIWQKCHDMKRVQNELEETYKQWVSMPTLLKWAKMEDWEAREAVENNELKRILRTSEDPVLRQIVMDDLEFVKIMRIMAGLVKEVLKRPKKNGVMPRNMREMIEVVKWLREERDKLLVGENRKRSEEPKSIVVNDNRKSINLSEKWLSLPPEERNKLFDQLDTVISQDHPALQEAREQIKTQKIVDV